MLHTLAWRTTPTHLCLAMEKSTLHIMDYPTNLPSDLTTVKTWDSRRFLIKTGISIFVFHSSDLLPSAKECLRLESCMEEKIFKNL